MKISILYYRIIENNALPKCGLDQWLEDYLEEMEVQQQQQEGEQKQSQQILDENNISLLDMCHNSDISSVEDDNSPSSGQFEENEDENYYEQDDNRDIFYNSCNCIFCSGSSMYGEQRGNIGTEPVTIQYGGGLPPIYGDEQQQQNYEKEQQEQEQEEEEVLGDDDLTVNVFNFPSTFFLILNCKGQNLLNISKMK